MINHRVKVVETLLSNLNLPLMDKEQTTVVDDSFIDFTEMEINTDNSITALNVTVNAEEDTEVVTTASGELVVRDKNRTNENKIERKFDPKQYETLFDDETVSRYRAYRIKKQDPVTCDDMDFESSFQFKYVWDCVTGERIGVDPHGPLYFSPVTILRTILGKILTGLWTEIDDCVPMYGENLGVGKQFNIPGRGPQLEKYAFRLPVQDCYIYRDSDKHGKSVHTLGPEFTDDELRHIDQLIQEYWFEDPYIENLPESALSTLELRKMYDTALDSRPTTDIEALPQTIRERYLRTLTIGNIDIDHNDFINRIAVDELKNMVGFRSRARF